MGFQADQDVATRSAARLLETILRQLGLGAPLLLPLACSSSSPAGDDEGGVTTNQSSGNEAPEGEGEASSSSATTNPDDETSNSTDADTGTEEDTGEIKLDVFTSLDGPPPPLCWYGFFSDPTEFPPEFADCSFAPLDPGLTPAYSMICVELPDGESCDDICTDGLCEGMQDCVYATIWDTCGPIEIDGACCTMILTEELPPVGRPFLVAGQPRLAAAPDRLGPRGAEPLAAHWLETARGEHASIAAFARFVATLLRFGAPARLVADALAAARDEVEHTRDALALASRFAGRPLALGQLDITAALRGSDELAQAVHDAVLEGCVGETLAAHEAVCLAAHADDPQVAATLRRVADDEARHAALAWRFVAWVLDTHPELRGAIERAFAEGLARAPRTGWRAIGLRELVSPCARQLLATATPSARTRSLAPTCPR